MKGKSPQWATKPKLVCPKCGKWVRCERDKSDPEGTTKIVVLCPECATHGGFEEIHYFDAAGKELQPATPKP